MPTTLREVARRAAVSTATVSRALNGLAVSPASRARVMAAVSELGYVANEAARTLRAERTMTMGVVFIALADALGIDLLDALSESVESAGYALLMSTARGDAGRFDVLMRRFLERRVDALFCVAPRGTAESLALYRNANTPVMTLFTSADAFAELPLVQPNIRPAARDLAQHLKGLGHRRVAVLRRKGQLNALDAVAKAITAAGLEFTDLDPFGHGAGEIAARLAAMPHRPTAIVAAHHHARDLLAACPQAGLSVPGDLSLAAVVEVGEDHRHRRRAISSLVVDPGRMGKAAGTAMLAWLGGEAPVGRLEVHTASFIPRETTGTAPAA